jgi:hypothetical protein
MSNLIRNCHRCGKDFSAPYKECLCEDCLKELGWESTPKTNADHIRSMTDEELAEFLCSVYDEIEDWLKQPYKEDGGCNG